MKPRVLVTGATGFVGRAVLRNLIARGVDVRGTGRRSSETEGIVPSPSLGADADWRPLLRGVDVVVHDAARVHVMDDSARGRLDLYREVNVAGTSALATQAAAAGVARFVFVSSIKVNGETTQEAVPFTAEDTPTPVEPYGVSKREAEDALFRLGPDTGMEIVVIRPPLVYGPGVKANFQAMMNWLMRGVPLPLGAVRNRRTLVALDNLVDLIVTCIDHPAARNQIFLAGDGEDLSTPDLLRRLAAALGVQARLWPVPVSWLTLAATVLGKRAVVQRLCSSLQVDISKANRLMGWVPPITVDEGLRRTAEHYLECRNS